MFDSDDAVFTDLGDYIGDEFANFGVTGGNSGDFGNFLIIASDFLGHFIDGFDDFGTGFFDTLAKFHWVVAGSNKFVSLSDNVIGKNGNSGSTITGDFVKLLGGTFDEFGADLIAESFIVFFTEIDSFSDSNAIVSDGWGAVAFFDYDITTFWTKSNFDCIVESLSATENTFTGVGIIENFLCHICRFSYLMVARISSSLTMRYSSFLTLTSVAEYSR